MVIMDDHARCPKETLLHLPSLVPSRSTNWPSSTSLPKTGLPDRPPEEEAKEMAGASSRLFHRPPDSGSRESGSLAGTATLAASVEPTSLGHRARRVRGQSYCFHWSFRHTSPSGRVLRDAQSQFEAYLTDSARLSGTLPPARAQSQMPAVAPSGCGEPGHEDGVSPTGPPS
jgi:hypothetical protein